VLQKSYKHQIRHTLFNQGFPSDVKWKQLWEKEAI